MDPRLGSATLSQLAFLGEGDPNFLREKSHWDNTAEKKIGEKKKEEVESPVVTHGGLVKQVGCRCPQRGEVILSDG